MTKVTQLPIATTITNYGVFVIVDGGITKQIGWQTLKSGAFKGDTGIQGPIGNTGTQGIQGPIGITGTAATVVVGTVVASTVTTSVTDVGTPGSAILNFVLQQGIQGIQGIQGPIGNTGTQGIQGPIGSTGTLADLQIGIVSTGTTATVGISTSSTITAVFTTSTTAATTASSTLTTIILTTSSSISTSSSTATVFTLITTSTTISTSSLTATIVTTISTATTRYGTFLNFVLPPTQSTVGIVSLTTATTSTAGVVKIGSGIDVSSSGTISVTPSNVVFTGGTVNNSSTFTNNLSVYGTFTAATLLVGSTGIGTVQSTNDLSLKAAGIITTNAPFVLPSYNSTTTLAALVGIPVGATVFVTNAPGGAQPCYFDGVHWYTFNGRVQVL
jgi:hypothetical protein